MEEATFLVTVQQIIGGIGIQPDLPGRLTVRLEFQKAEFQANAGMCYSVFESQQWQRKVEISPFTAARWIPVWQTGFRWS